MTTDPARDLTRRLWEAIEPLHGIVYFAPEPTDALRGLGLRGFWMSYFAGRFASVGPIGPEPAAAMAFGFALPMVARALPDAWAFAPVDRIVPARVAGSIEALRRTLPSGSDEACEALVDLLDEAGAGCDCDGRPLAASWKAVTPPDDVLGRLWLQATVLREHRGDGHVLAAVALGLDGLENTLTFVASGALRREEIQPHRGWGDVEWEAAAARLRDRELLDGDGRLTDAGAALRRDVEATTDRLALGPVARLGPAATERVIELATPLSRHLIDSGTIPHPNPVGAPRP